MKKYTNFLWIISLMIGLGGCQIVSNPVQTTVSKPEPAPAVQDPEVAKRDSAIAAQVEAIAAEIAREKAEAENAQEEKRQAEHIGKVVTGLLNSDENTSVLGVENKTICDITLAVKGKQNYSITVESQKTGHILVENGSYEVSGDVCAAKYRSRKQVDGNTIITLRVK